MSELEVEHYFRLRRGDSDMARALREEAVRFECMDFVREGSAMVRRADGWEMRCYRDAVEIEDNRNRIVRYEQGGPASAET